MESMEILTGSTNKFDRGFSLGPSDFKAIRDTLVFLIDKIKKLEARLPKEKETQDEPKVEPKEEQSVYTPTQDEPVYTEPVKAKKGKKNA